VAAIRDARPDDSHAVVSIPAHLSHKVCGGMAVADKENVAHELADAATAVYELSR
jgi:hypothetical protein